MQTALHVAATPTLLRSTSGRSNDGRSRPRRATARSRANHSKPITQPNNRGRFRWVARGSGTQNLPNQESPPSKQRIQSVNDELPPPPRRMPGFPAPRFPSTLVTTEAPTGKKRTAGFKSTPVSRRAGRRRNIASSNRTLTLVRRGFFLGPAGPAARAASMPPLCPFFGRRRSTKEPLTDDYDQASSPNKSSSNSRAPGRES